MRCPPLPAAGLIAAALVVPLSPADAAAALPGFDCGQARTRVEKVICTDPTLSALDGEMARLYRSALDREPARAAEIRADQRRWLASRARCGLEDRAGAGLPVDGRPLDCLREAYHRRNSDLATPPEQRPRAIRMLVHAETTEDVAACRALLTPSSIVWQGKGAVSAADIFSLEPPAGFGEPDWEPVGSSGPLTIARSREDFLRDGSPRTLYRLMVEGSRIDQAAYVLVDPEEEQEVRSMMSLEEGRIWNVIEDLQRQLTHPILRNEGSTANRSGTDNTTTVRMRSGYYDASNSDAYEAWYTRSTVLKHETRLYVVGISVNNLRGPTAAVFRPRPGGMLETLCTYEAPAGTIEKVRVVQHGEHACPVEDDLKRKPEPMTWRDEIMQPPSGDPELATAVIDDPVWGGRLRAIRETGQFQRESWNRVWLTADLDGSLAAIKANIEEGPSWDDGLNLGSPATGLDEGSYDLVLAGPDGAGRIYLESTNGQPMADEQPPAGTAYFLPGPEGDPVLTCRFADMAVNPTPVVEETSPP